MKAFLFLIMLITRLNIADAQHSFSISGNSGGLTSGTARLTYIREGKTKQISSGIKNGKFLFTGSLPEPQRLIINFTTDQFNGETVFFAGNEKISITVDTSRLKNPVVRGSQLQEDFELYNQLVKIVDEKSEALNKSGAQLYLSGKLTEQLKDSLFDLHDKLDGEKRLIIADFAKAHPGSAVSAWAISSFYGYDPRLEELIPVFNSLSGKNQRSLYGKEIKEIIDAAKKTALGIKAADFTLNDKDGNPVTLSAYQGKYLFIDFWASWCGPCRAENPNVANAYRKYHSDQFDILGVSLDDSRDAWLKAVNNDKLEWAQVSDLKAWDSKIVTGYGIKGIPFNMLLDKEGRIIARNLRGPSLDKKLKEILN